MSVLEDTTDTMKRVSQMHESFTCNGTLIHENSVGVFSE